MGESEGVVVTEEISRPRYYGGDNPHNCKLCGCTVGPWSLDLLFGDHFCDDCKHLVHNCLWDIIKERIGD